MTILIDFKLIKWTGSDFKPTIVLGQIWTGVGQMECIFANQYTSIHLV